MRSRRNTALLFCLLLSCFGSVSAAPPAGAPAPPSASAIPDYGGRESGPVAVSDTAPNPLAQMGRAAEALLIVLAGVVGVVYALKRFGLVTPGENGKPGRIAWSGLSRVRPAQLSGDIPVTVLSSQTLPGGAMLHVVSVAGRKSAAGSNAAVGVGADRMARCEEAGAEPEAFDEYLSRADAASVGTGLAAANARLRSLMARPPLDENR